MINIPEKEIFVEPNRLITLIFAIGLFSTILIICGVWFISGALTKPINNLTEIFQVVAGGNFDEPIDLTRRDELGSLAKSFAFMRDEVRKQILMLKESENELRESKERYRSLYNEFRGSMEATPDVLTLLSPDMKIIWTNTEGKDKDTPTHIGKYCYEVRHVHPETCIGCPVIKCIDTRQFESSETTTPDGRIWELRAVPIFDENSQVKGVVEAARNITKRRKAEEALKESEKQLRNIGDNLPGGMIYQLLLHPDGTKRFTYVSAGVERLHGYTQEQVLAGPTLLYNDIHPDDIEWTIAEEKKALRELGTFDVEVRLLKKSGEVRWRRIVSQIRKLPSGEVVGDGVELDITERRRAKEELQKAHDELEQRVMERTAQLKEANNELESFSYSVSHDLRAPLRHIAGFVALLIKHEQERLDATSTHYLEVISHSTNRMGALIDDLLALSRAARSEIRYQAVELDTIVREAQQELVLEMGERKIV